MRRCTSSSTQQYDFLKERHRWEPLVTFEHDLADKHKVGTLIPVERDSAEWNKFESQYPELLSSSSFSKMNCIPLRDGTLLVPVDEQRRNSRYSKMQSRFKGMKDLAYRTSITNDETYTTHDVKLPEGSTLDMIDDCLLSYLLDAYSFDRYKTNTTSPFKTQLWFPSSDRVEDVLAMVRATYLVQDLISTPARDLTPLQFQQVTEAWAATCCNEVSVETIVGNDLLSYNGSIPNGHGCGMIHAVGQGVHEDDDRLPRLIRLQYRPKSSSSKNHSKKIALVGKGVTYDTGGLNLKPGNSMLHMKKDMGGAAHVLGLVSALVERQFPAPVDVWIPLVENVLGAHSFRPGDVLTSVLGTTTEVGNTDAEGRLILADALALASAEEPTLIVDVATLTGAARVAMGTEVVPFFCNDEELSSDIVNAAVAERDPMWPMPLWEGYRERITKSSKLADLRNVPSDNGLGGAITAALYLQEFVGTESDRNDDTIPAWVHMDVYAMDGTTGVGLAQGLRAMFRFLWDHVAESQQTDDSF